MSITANLINDNCTSLTGWTYAANWNILDGFHWDGSVTGDLIQNFSVTGTAVTLEITTYFNGLTRPTLATHWVSDISSANLTFYIGTNTKYVSLFFSGNGDLSYIYTTDEWTYAIRIVDGDLNGYGVHTWRFEIDEISDSFSTYKDDVLVGTFAMGDSNTWSQACFKVTGTSKTEGHILSIKVGDGLGDFGTTQWKVLYYPFLCNGYQSDSNSPYIPSSTVTVLNNTEFSRENYTFSKWNTKMDGSGIDYNPNDTFTITTNTTFYPIWTVNVGADASLYIPIDTRYYQDDGLQIPILGIGGQDYLIEFDCKFFEKWTTFTVCNDRLGFMNFYDVMYLFLIRAATPSRYIFVDISNIKLHDKCWHHFKCVRESGIVNVWIDNYYHILPNVLDGFIDWDQEEDKNYYFYSLKPTRYNAFQIKNYKITINGTDVIFDAPFDVDYFDNSTYANHPFPYPSNVIQINAVSSSSITYDVNTGSGTPPVDNNSPYTVGTSVVTLENTDLTKINYLFSGWNLSTDGLGFHLDPGDSYIATNSSTVFYADWAQTIATGYVGRSFTDTTNNGDWAVFPDIQIMVGSSPGHYKIGTAVLFELPISIPENSVITSAYVVLTGKDVSGSYIKMRISGQLDNNAELIAGFTPSIENFLKARGLVSGGTGSTTNYIYWDDVLAVEGQPFQSPSLINILQEISNLGKVTNINLFFDDFDNRTVNGINVFDIPPNAAKLYYSFITGPFTVTYDINGGTGVVPIDNNSPYIAKTTVTVLSSDNLIKEGFVAAGWNTAPDGSGIPYSPNDTFEIMSDTIFYVFWKKLHKINDVVTNNGSAYICKQFHIPYANTEPGIGANWQTYWNCMIDKHDALPVPILENDMFFSKVLNPGSEFTFDEDLTDRNGQTVTTTGQVSAENGIGTFVHKFEEEPYQAYLYQTITENTDLGDNGDFEITFSDFYCQADLLINNTYMLAMFGDIEVGTLLYFIYERTTPDDKFHVYYINTGSPVATDSFTIAGTQLLSPHTYSIKRTSGIYTMTFDGNPCTKTSSDLDGVSLPSFVGKTYILGSASPVEVDTSYFSNVKIIRSTDIRYTWVRQPFTTTLRQITNKLHHDNIAALAAEDQRGGSGYYHLTKNQYDSLTGPYAQVIDLIGYYGSPTFNSIYASYIIPEGTPINAVSAQGTITLNSIPELDESFIIDSAQFSWTTTRTQNYEVSRGATISETIDNIVYALSTDLSGAFTITRGAGDTVIVEYNTKGIIGNSLTFTEGSMGMTMDGSGYLGGTRSGINGTEGNNGQMFADNNYFYICTATNTINDANWRRILFNGYF